MTVDEGRLVTLVVVDSAGNLRGATEEVEVRLPYWQETGPVAEVLPGSTVLRLLDGGSDSGAPRGGHVQYLVQSDAPAQLVPWRGSLDAHPLRMPWATPGGPAADIAWVETVVDVSGPAVQHRSWNLSALWSFPTTEGTVWLKCVPQFFRHEVTVLERLQGGPVPQLIAADGHRILMAELPGEDGWHASESEQIEMITTLVDLQADLSGDAEVLVDARIPDLRAPHLVSELSTLVDEHAPHNAALRQLVEALPARLEEVEALGVPDTLVHGDAHTGNCRRGVNPPIWFDWGDSFIGNPLLDLAALSGMAPNAQQHWFDAWTERVPDSNPERAWTLLRPVAELRAALVYQGFLDRIEPAERVYHRDDLPAALAAAETAYLEGS